MDIDVRLIYRLIPKTHEFLKSYIFLVSHFSPEWDRQPVFKFNIDLDVLLIYRLILKKPDVLGLPAIFDTTPISRSVGASRSVHGHIQHKSACF
jgi:hypothetical protein